MSEKYLEPPHIIHSELWVPEFFHMVKVLEFGRTKHGASNWLQPNGRKSSFKQMHDSMFHHLAESYAAGLDPMLRRDKESQLDSLLHLQTRAAMCYTRIKRGLICLDD
jgi:hypothetical protein